MLQSKEIIFKGYESNRNLPINFKNEDEQYFKKDFIRCISDTALYNYTNVIVTVEGLVLNNLSVQQEFLIRSQINQYSSVSFYLKNIVNYGIKFLNKNEKYAIVTDNWSVGYFHFLCDTLPRLMALKSKVAGFTLLLPESCHSFHVELLKYFSIQKIEFYNNTQLLFCPNLYIPNVTKPTGNYNKELLLKVKQQFKLNTSQSIGSQKNIYISRKKAARRKLADESEIEKILVSYNFQIICTEDYSMDEKIELFKNCNILISIHGAGLTNMLFMQEHSKVLEIRLPNDNHNLAYFTLASDLNLDYYYMFCEASNNESTEYTIDMERFKKILNEITNT